MSSGTLQLIKERLSGLSGQAFFDENLSKHTYYRIGGPADVLVIPKGLEDLKIISTALEAVNAPFFILGAGSNVLVSDQGFRGMVIKTTRLNLDISVSPGPEEASLLLKTGSSVNISSLLRRAAQEGWAGLEFLTGIPGSIGGVVTMNAGTHLGEAKDALEKVEAVPLRGASAGIISFERPVLRFEYRKNLFLPEGALVWSAEWKVRKTDPSVVKAAIDETLRRRKATQPIDYPSCGSVFKNPIESGMKAWQVVDKLGLRGFRKGDAQFSEKHSNFIINLGNARAADVHALILLAKTRALDELNVTLEEEVKLVGDHS